uniref:Uncharacterized protein n=1 Tax=Corvus moneduloides TaxID=1196302 RepID=A0A8U7NAW8_CORMO
LLAASRTHMALWSWTDTSAMPKNSTKISLKHLPAPQTRAPGQIWPGPCAPQSCPGSPRGTISCQGFTSSGSPGAGQGMAQPWGRAGDGTALGQDRGWHSPGAGQEMAQPWGRTGDGTALGQDRRWHSPGAGQGMAQPWGRTGDGTALGQDRRWHSPGAGQAMAQPWSRTGDGTPLARGLAQQGDPVFLPEGHTAVEQLGEQDWVPLPVTPGLSLGTGAQRGSGLRCCRSLGSVRARP